MSRIEIGQVWRVFDRQRVYLAEVIGFVAERIEIRELPEVNIARTTPTLARRSAFGTGQPRCKGFQLVGDIV